MPEYKYSRTQPTKPSEGLHDDACRKEDGVGRSTKKLYEN